MVEWEGLAFEGKIASFFLPIRRHVDALVLSAVGRKRTSRMEPPGLFLPLHAVVLAPPAASLHYPPTSPRPLPAPHRLSARLYVATFHYWVYRRGNLAVCSGVKTCQPGIDPDRGSDYRGRYRAWHLGRRRRHEREVQRQLKAGKKGCRVRYGP